MGCLEVIPFPFLFPVPTLQYFTKEDMAHMIPKTCFEFYSFSTCSYSGIILSSRRGKSISMVLLQGSEAGCLRTSESEAGLAALPDRVEDK